MSMVPPKKFLKVTYSTTRIPKQNSKGPKGLNKKVLRLRIVDISVNLSVNFRESQLLGALDTKP